MLLRAQSFAALISLWLLSHCHTSVRGPAFSEFLPFLPVSIWLLLEVLDYYISVHLALNCLFMLIVL